MARRSLWRSYWRSKRIARIRALQTTPRTIVRSTFGSRRRRRGPLFTGQQWYWFGLTLVCCGGVNALLKPLLTSLPGAVVFPLGLMLLFVGIELADQIWLRSYRLFEQAVYAVALVLFIGIPVGLFALASSPDLGQRTKAAIAHKHREVNRDLQRRDRVRVVGPEEGDNWSLLAEETPQGRVYFMGDLATARARCAALGPGARLPRLPEELRELQPHPMLPRSLDVWLDSGKRAQLDPAPSTSGRVQVTGRADDLTEVLCLLDEAGEAAP